MMLYLHDDQAFLIYFGDIFRATNRIKFLILGWMIIDAQF